MGRKHKHQIGDRVQIIGTVCKDRIGIISMINNLFNVYPYQVYDDINDEHLGVFRSDELKNFNQEFNNKVKGYIK